MTEYIVLNPDDTIAAKATSLPELKQKLAGAQERREVYPVYQRTGLAVLVQSVEVLPDDATPPAAAPE